MRLAELTPSSGEREMFGSAAEVRTKAVALESVTLTDGKDADGFDIIHPDRPLFTGAGCVEHALEITR